MTLIDTIQTKLRKRLSYIRLQHEIRAMPLDVALDLDIYREDAALIARKAIYG